MTQVPVRFPKVKSPYERSENDRNDYTVDDDITDGYSWVFDRAEEVKAVEKLHGTNVSVLIEDGKVVDAATRMGNREMNLVVPYGPTNHHYITRGVQNSVQRGYTDSLVEGWNFGELVGPSLHNNPYELDEHLFIPFSWMRDKCSYKSYGEHPTNLDAISGWFKDGLFSLFNSRIHGVGLDESSVSNGTFVEGIIFVHPDLDGRIHPEDMETVETTNYDSVATPLAKLRRDMFDWYEGSL